MLRPWLAGSHWQGLHHLAPTSWLAYHFSPHFIHHHCNSTDADKQKPPQGGPPLEPFPLAQWLCSSLPRKSLLPLPSCLKSSLCDFFKPGLCPSTSAPVNHSYSYFIMINYSYHHIHHLSGTLHGFFFTLYLRTGTICRLWSVFLRSHCC